MTHTAPAAEAREDRYGGVPLGVEAFIPLPLLRAAGLEASPLEQASLPSPRSLSETLQR